MPLNEYFIMIMSLAGIAWLAFDRTAKVASLELKEKVREGFKRKINAEKWPEISKDFINDMFGAKHWAWSCLKRSAIISLVWMVLIVLLLPIFNVGDGYQEFIDDLTGESDIVSVFIFFFTLNILPDYLSVWETRVILAKIGKAKFHKIPIFLIVDFVFTTLIFFVVSFLYFLIFIMFMSQFPSLDDIAEMLGEGGLVGLILNERSDNHISVFGYAALLTTFLTSIWIWFYLVAVGYSKITKKFVAPAWNATLRFVDVEAKPVESLGYISGIVVIVIGIVFSPLVIFI